MTDTPTTGKKAPADVDLATGLSKDREGSHHLARARAIEDLGEASLKHRENKDRLRELRLARDALSQLLPKPVAVKPAKGKEKTTR